MNLGAEKVLVGAIFVMDFLKRSKMLLYKFKEWKPTAD
jgi:hypothetical protein